MSDIKLEIQSNISELLKQIKDLNSETNKLSSGYKSLSQSVSNSNNSLRSASQNWQKINEISKQYEEQSKMAGKADEENWNNGIKKINEYYNSYKKLVSNIGSLSLRMAGSIRTTAMGMSPISPSEFSSGFSLNPKTLFGFGDAMKNAFGMMKEMQQMRHDLAYLSDDAGDASKALNTVFNIASGSAISRITSQGVVRALADQGLRLTDSAGKASPKIERLGILAGNLQAATGIAASQWGSFTGELDFNYGLSEEGLGGITSALVGTGLGAQQLERAVTSINKVLQNTAFIAGVPTEKAVLGLTKAIGGAMKVFNKFNIPAEKAATLIEGILDPENFQKNSYLFARLGIGASEYAGYLNDVNGQQMLLEKVMSNLPQLASEVANIGNPFARMEIAKSLGLDMQTVRRFASASGAEIEEIMKEYVEANKNQEALDKKKKKMAAEAAKYDDFIFGLKMKVLAPIMKILQGGMLNKFMAIMPKLAQSMANVFIEIAPVATMIMDGLVSVAPIIANFVQRIGGAIGWLFNAAGGQSGIINFLDGKYQDVKNNGNSFLESFGEIASILSKIYLAVKAVQIGKFFLDTARSLGGFVGSAFNKAIGWIMPSKKLIINATVGDLAEAIGKEVKPGLGGKSFGGLLGSGITTGLLGLLGIGAGSLIFKMLFGTKEYKEFENIANEASTQGRAAIEQEAKSNFGKDMGERAFMYGGGMSILGGRMLYQGAKGAYQSGAQVLTEASPELIKRFPNLIKSSVINAGREGFTAGTGVTATTGIGKTIAGKIVLPAAALMTMVDAFDTYNSEASTAVKTIKTLGIAANAAGVAFGIAAVVSIPTVIGAGTAGIASALSFAAGTILMGIGSWMENTEELEARRAKFNKTFNLAQNKALAELLTNNEKIKTATGEMVDKESVAKYATYDEFQKGIEARANKDLILQKSLFKNETTFLKEKAAIALLSNDINVIEATQAQYKKQLLKENQNSQKIVEEILRKEFENIETTKKQLIDRKIEVGQQIITNEKLFGGLYDSFKVGNFDGLFKILSIMLDKLKLTFLQIYHSIPGIQSSSTLNIGESFFGNEFYKKYSGEIIKTRKDMTSMGMVGDKDTRDFLQKKLQDIETTLNTTVDTESKMNQKLTEMERIKAIKENNANLKKNTEVLEKVNNSLLNPKSMEEIQQRQKQIISDVFF
jgi:hypothetical protein